MIKSQGTRVTAAALGALGLGAALGWFAARGGATRALQTELSADAAYFFSGQDESPISGVLRRGAKVRVHMRKGGAVYVSVETVLERDAFEQAASLR